MIKELITFIAHKTAVEILSPRFRPRGPHDRVKHIIWAAIIFTIVAIVLVTNTFFLQKRIPITPIIFFSFFLLAGFVHLLVGFIFKRNIMVRAIRMYKGTKLATYAGAIGLGYFLLILAVLLLTLIFGVKRY